MLAELKLISFQKAKGQNQLQINNFLQTEWGKKFTLIEDKIILSYQTGFDGFYLAKLERTQE